jgi:hypothetical protein
MHWVVLVRPPSEYIPECEGRRFVAVEAEGLDLTHSLVTILR